MKMGVLSGHRRNGHLIVVLSYARVGAVLGALLFASVALGGLTPSRWIALVVLGSLLGAGYRRTVSISAQEIRITSAWTFIPLEDRRFPLDTRIEVYRLLERPEGEGVVLAERTKNEVVLLTDQAERLERILARATRAAQRRRTRRAG
jgi:hypothetical protein